MQRSNVYTSYNLFFIIPFILWIIAGGLLQYYLDQPTLFIYINARYNSNLDGFMSLVTNMGESIFIIPAAMLLFIRKEYRNWSYVFAAVTANIGAFFLSQALKSYFDYPRPLNFFREAKWIHFMPEWEQHFHRSFPSGHTTGAFALFCFLSLLLKPGYRGWGLFFFALALLTGYSRIYLAAHFLSDVYVGSIIGSVISILAITIFYRRPSLHNTNAS